MSNTILKSVLRANFDKTVAQRGLHPGQLVHLFVEVSGEAMVAGSATFSDAGTSGETFLSRRLQSHDLACRKESDRIVIGA